jgi:hypothetical protein
MSQVRRWLGAAALSLALLLPYTTPAAAQAPCEFKLGFRAIAERIPTVVGVCLENEHHNPANGDALQRTSGGLLVWRKADNFTAFTDGHRSWVNGPFGLQSRLNTERFAWEAAAPDAACVDVGGERCLPIDPLLRGAVDALRGVEEGAWLLRQAAHAGVSVRRQPLREGIHGAYRPGTNTIVISSRLDAVSVQARATVLAHELRHAVDDAQGTLGSTEAECLKSEEDAFRVQARVWAALWQGQLPSGGGDAMQDELNAIALTAARDPARLARALAGLYHEECRAFGP